MCRQLIREICRKTYSWAPRARKGIAIEPRLRIDTTGPVATIVLDRPAVRNALDAGFIAAVTEAISRLSADPGIRAIVLRGQGEHFCAGADLAWMRASAGLSEAENRAEAIALGAMFDAVDRCPKPVVAAVTGAAIGGGAGLVAACDLAVACDDAIFAFSEVRLGLIPAVISPYVLAKIGLSQTRALFLTGERIDAATALRIGLVHSVVSADAFEAAVERKIAALLAAGPQALAETKRLLRDVTAHATQRDVVTELTAEAIARVRTGDEARAGISAFLEKAKAPWAP